MERYSRPNLVISDLKWCLKCDKVISIKAKNCALPDSHDFQEISAFMLQKNQQINELLSKYDFLYEQWKNRIDDIKKFTNPFIEPFLKQIAEVKDELRIRISNFKDRVQEIFREIERIQKNINGINPVLLCKNLNMQFIDLEFYLQDYNGLYIKSELEFSENYKLKCMESFMFSFENTQDFKQLFSQLENIKKYSRKYNFINKPNVIDEFNRRFNEIFENNRKIITSKHLEISNLHDKISELTQKVSLLKPRKITEDQYAGALYKKSAFELEENKEKLYKNPIHQKIKPAGIKNEGNTCYINSVIQCLFASNDFMTLIKLRNNDKNNGLLGYEFCKKYEELLTNNSYIQIRSILEYLFENGAKSSFPRYDNGKYKQGDSLGAYLEIIDLLIKEEMKHSGATKPEYTEIYKKFTISKLLRRTCSRKGCEKTVDTPDTAKNIAVSAQGKKVEFGIDLHNKISIISQSTCEKCKMKTDLKNWTIYTNLPKILVVSTQRETPIRKIDKALSIMQNNLIVYYKLFACVIYTGNGASGHYFANVKYGNQWYQANDTTIREIHEKDFETSAAYVLFYERSD